MMPSAGLNFKRCSAAVPCPICAGKDWCEVTAEGPVWCMRADRDGISVQGWKRARRGGQHPTGGRLFIPDGYEGERVVKSPEQRAKEEAEKKKWQEYHREQAARIWHASVRADKPAGWPVGAYLASRGIDVARLPGGVPPAVLRFNARVRDVKVEGEGAGVGKKVWLYSPAMVAVVQGADGKGRGVHRTFLAVDREKRTAVKFVGGDGAESRGGKKQLGPCSGGAVRLWNPTHPEVMVLTEGIETGLAVVQTVSAQGASGKVGVWSVMDGPKLQRAAEALPDGLVGVRGSVSVVVIAGDLDKSGAGAKYAGVAANALRVRCPWLTVRVRMPGGGVCPRLVEGEGDSAKVREAGGKGVDWLDVLRESGEGGVWRGVFGAGVEGGA